MVKKILLICMLAITALGQLHAANLSESFDAATFPPDGWQALDLDHQASYYWKRINYSTHSGAGCAYAYGDTSDWLIGPAVYPAGAGDTLSFWTRGGGGGAAYNDSFRVYISTTDSLPQHFSPLQTVYNPGTSTAYHQVKVPLGTYATQKVFIAFVNCFPNIFTLYLDDVAGPETTPPVYSHDMAVSAVLYPNAAVVPPLTPFQPDIEISNFGTATESGFWTRCWISDSLGAVVYNDSLFHGGAMGTGSETLLFPAFAPDSVMRYTLTAVVTVPVDQSRHNDTLRFAFRSWGSYDVGTSAVPLAAAVYAINDTLRPQAEYTNYGTETTTFLARYQIQRGAAVIVSGDTVLTIGSSSSSSLLLPAVGPPLATGYYTITAWTECWRDTSLANDTLRAHFSVTDWKMETVTPLPDRRISHATAYDPVGDRVYVLGGAYGSVNSYVNTYRYDPELDSWSALASMPAPGTYWGSAAYCRGKICVMGGGDWNSGNAQSVNRIYDIAGDNWSAGAAMSEPVVANGLAAWRDTLIYRIGGDPWDYTPLKTTVQVYDPLTNGWAAASSLPIGWAWGGCAILGDTIYLIGGKYQTGYLNTVVRGVINPTEPASIAWSAGPALPVPIVNARENGADAAPGYLFYQGGAIDSSVTTYTDNVWTYDLSTGYWSQLPSLPTANTRIDNLVFRQGHQELYVIGGDSTGNYESSASVYRYRKIVAGIAGAPAAITRPGSLALHPSYPNPARGRATFSFSLPAAGAYDLRIYNLAGQLVRTLSGQGTTGANKIVWNAGTIANGVYFYGLRSGGRSANGKLVVLK